MSKKVDRTGETRVMNNALTAKIIACRTAKSIDVEFENGAIAQDVQYDNFLKRKVKCPMIIENVDDYCRIINANTNPVFSFLIDKEDIPLIGDSIWSEDANGYVRQMSSGKIVFIHRLITNAPADMQVDHINGNRADNRKQNLRICSKSENMKNVGKRSNNTSGYKGVWWHKQNGKWAAEVHTNGNKISLGLYDDVITAARAYNEAAIQYHGEFAKLNIIP